MFLLQPATAAPGRGGPGDAPPPPAAPAATITEQPVGAPAAPPPEAPGAWSGMALVLPFLLLFGLLFFMNRGEKKKRTAFESKLKRGDKVVTRAGIKGKLVELGEGGVKVEIAPGVTVAMVKGAIEALDPGDAPAAQGAFKDTKLPAKDGKDAKDGGEPKDAKDLKDKKK